MSGMSAGCSLSLRLHSGVPILDVLGKWEPALTAALTDTIGALAEAGHFDIVVNVQRASFASLEGVSALQSLARAAQAIRSHCGHLDVVGTVEQIEALLAHHTDGLFRMASTEEGAIGRIKRVPVLTTGVRCTTRTVA